MSWSTKFTGWVARGGVVAAALAFAVGAAAQGQSGQTARAELKNAKGETVGQADLRQTPNGVLIALRLTSAPSGEHAFHIHQTGKCDPPSFDSAGGHFNPSSKSHGFEMEAGPHAGDMPNLHIPESGSLQAEILAPHASMSDLFDDDGAALVLHEGADDYRSQPSGAAGSRVACGVVMK